MAKVAEQATKNEVKNMKKEENDFESAQFVRKALSTKKSSRKKIRLRKSYDIKTGNRKPETVDNKKKMGPARFELVTFRSLKTF